MAEAPKQPPRTPPAKPAKASGIAASLRGADFPLAVRGYDRHQVDEFLSAVAKRLESESDAFDPEAMKRQLEAVGESTTGILTAAEETARKLQTDASTEAGRVRQSATEAAERARNEAAAFAQSTRESASQEERRLLAEATRKAQQVVAAADQRAQELLNRSVERRRVLAATIDRLDARRAEIAADLRALADELEVLAEQGEDLEPIESAEGEHPAQEYAEQATEESDPPVDASP